MNFGHHPYKGIPNSQEIKNPTTEEFVKTIQQTWQTAQQSLHKAAETMKKQYDKHRQPSIEYQPGDKVYLDTENLPSHHKNPALKPKFEGPFQVKEKVGPSAY